MHDPQQKPDSAESARDTAKLPNWDQACEEAGTASSPWGPMGGKAVEQLEDFSLAMDSDIYLYMQRFCAAEYQGVLQQHRVDVVDVSSDGIAMLYLQPAAGMPGDMDALREACLALQELYQQLEVSLCKEKITKGGLGMDSQALRALTCELQKLYPQLLCHEDVKQLYLIGNLVDVSHAKQYLQDFSTRGGAAQVVPMVSSSLPSQPATSHTTENTLHKPKEPAGTSASRLSPGRPELRGELKLAANFGTLKADKSQDSPPVGQAPPSGKHPPQIDALGPSDPTALTQQYQPGVSTAGVDLGSAAVSQQKDPKEWDQLKGGARLTRHKALSAFGGKENSTSQHPGDSKGPGPIKHHSLAGTSSAFDTTRTSKPSESKPLLRRSSSFCLPRTKENEKLQDTVRAGSEGGRAREEMSLDSLQWSYLKDVHRAAVDELCRDGGVQLSEHHAGDCTVLMLQAEDRDKLFQAKWKVESLVQKCPDLVCQRVSYSELAVDGPDDSALSELCNLLRGNSFKVGLSKEKYNLYLACPKEMLPGVTEAFEVFSFRRLRALKSSSLSPGPESTGYSSVVQPSRSQDKVLGAALSGSLESLQMDLQDLSINDKAEFTDALRAFQLPEAKRSPNLWGLQHTLGQEKANDHVDSGAEQGGSDLLSPGVVDKSSPTGLRESQEQLRTKLAVGEPDTARLRQVLPDRFQFARDNSRGGHGEVMGRLCSPVRAADGAPHSLPARLCRPTEAAALAPARALLPAGSSSAQERQTRGPSLGQESSMTPLGRCDACHGSGMTCQAPCGHSLCRTCFAGDSAQPPCCSSSALSPGCRISGTFQISSLSQSLPGYYRDPTLQVAYIIPDGVQGVGDPHPGQPYKGGHFCAFLPDNREGQKTAVLLKKAFDCGLTFHIKSCNGEERVTWGLIPHKTSWNGGKARNGYPDALYLREVCAVLKKLGIA
uniref:E3 ubiquitin-protein ligase n=2 Tax=Strigops habroptila TaxID=2489341 RepID=A0A672UK35_STRHB